MSNLFQQIKMDPELKGFSPNTVKLYLMHVRLFSDFYNNTSLESLGEEQVRNYLHHIIIKRNLSVSYVNSAYSAIRFLYETTLDRDWNMKKIPLYQLKAMNSIETYRTSALGGHIEECDSCGNIRISYNSCRNRHCPKCQTLTRERWIEDRKVELLPVQYFHVVFTIPEELNALTLRNLKVMYDILFKAVSKTLIDLGKDKEHIGAELGFIALLHTWGQNLMHHPHIHCIIPGGGLSNGSNK